MHVLLVGAGGFIGSTVGRALEAAGHEVVRVGGSYSVGRPGAQGYSYKEGLYTALQQELSTVDLVVYAAGRVVPTTNVSVNEALALDGKPLGELLESLSQCGRRPVFVLLSTAGAIYGSVPEGEVLTEQSHLRPLSVYGLVRSHMEQVLGFHQRLGRVRGVTLRLSNVFGPGQRVNGPAAFVVRALTAAKTGVPMELWGGGHQRKDFLYVDDVVSAVEAAVTHASSSHYDGTHDNVFNVCRGESETLLEVLDTVEAVTGKEVPRRVIPAREGDVPRVELSNAVAARALAWRPTTSLKDGIAKFWGALG